MNGNPLLSVCVPVYNPGPYLEPALASILAQNFRDFELIIIDDRSTQAVEELVCRFADPRIRFERNPTNLGLTGNWNRCLELARGKYVTIFHQDDVMLPGNLDKKLAVLESDPRVGLVYSDIQRIDGSGQVIGGHYIPQPRQDCVMPGHELYHMVSQTGNPVACPAVMASKDCYAQVGIFDPRLKFAVDVEMWMRIASQYKVGYLSQPLIQMRVHDSQETFRFKSSGKDYQDVLNCYEIVYSASLAGEYAAHARQTFLTLAGHSLGMAKWMVKQGRLRLGFRYLQVYLKSLQDAGRYGKTVN